MSAVILNAVGDVWFGDHPVCIGHGVRSTRAHRPPGFLFEKVSSVLKEGDFAFCNLEGVISDKQLDPTSLASVEMRGSPAAIDDLASAGFNVVSVANNHIMQHGMEAFQDTLATLQGQGIAVAGVERESKSTPVFLNKNGVSLALLAFSLREETYHRGPTPYSYRSSFDEVLSEVASVRADFPGFVICSLHWGEEFLDLPSPAQRLMARQLVDAGADVILGGHSHVWQGVERIGSSIVFYSLGNFLFDLWQEECRISAIARIQFGSDGRVDYRQIPIWINESFQPETASGSRLKEIQRRFADIESRLRTQDTDLVTYLQQAEAATLRFRHQSYRYFAANIHRYPIGMLVQSCTRTARRIAGRALHRLARRT